VGGAWPRTIVIASDLSSGVPSGLTGRRTEAKQSAFKGGDCHGPAALAMTTVDAALIRGAGALARALTEFLCGLKIFRKLRGLEVGSKPGGGGMMGLGQKGFAADAEWTRVHPGRLVKTGESCA
jgi:hypothetical protein